MKDFTVKDLKELLHYHDDDTIVRIAVNSRNGLTQVADFGYFTVSTPEVWGKEIVIHPSEKAE